MKVTRSLFAILTLVRAAYLQRPRNPEAFWVAKQMAVSEQVDHVGWSPVPTPAPGVAKDNEIVLDVLKRQIATTSLTGWVNAQTCGWYAEYVSSAFTCGKGGSCVTNSVHIVGCDLNEYETCLGGDRVTSFSEQCGGRVLCCIWSNTACGTYTWARSPALSRYDCFTESTIWSMLDAPAVLIQESIFSKTFRVPTPPYVSTSITAAGPSTTADGTPRNTIGEDNSGGNPGDTPAANLASKTQILAGSIVGGTVGLLLILFLFCARRRIVCGLKSKRDIKDTGTPKVAQVGDNQKGFWNLKPELDATTVRAELEGAPGEERDAGIRVWKPELEGTPGIPGLSGIYVRKKSELEACGLAAQSGSRDIAAGPSSIEDRRHTSVQLKTSGVHEMAA